MGYIFGAYAIIFGIIGVYLLTIMGRQRSLEREIENMRRVLEREGH